MNEIRDDTHLESNRKGNELRSSDLHFLGGSDFGHSHQCRSRIAHNHLVSYACRFVQEELLRLQLPLQVRNLASAEWGQVQVQLE
jgi:hypothetical protein